MKRSESLGRTASIESGRKIGINSLSGLPYVYKKHPTMRGMLLVYAEEMILKSSQTTIGSAFRELDFSNIRGLTVLYGNSQRGV